METLIRPAKASDMPAIFMMGYDVWGDGESPSDHVASCFAAKKYTRGTWYVLEKDGVPISALICYRNAFNLPEGFVGIGSVATSPQHRKRGYASHLIKELMSQLSNEETVKAFFLFSDIDPKMYERLGFVRLQKELQRYEKSVAMICPAVEREYQPPDYF